MSGWLAGRVTTCSLGGLADSRLCRDGYEFEADTTGEAREGEPEEEPEDRLTPELLAETRTNEQATSALENKNFCTK